MDFTLILVVPARMSVENRLSTVMRKLRPSLDAVQNRHILGLEVEHAWTEAQVPDCLNN
jgi:hypothetical protein